MKCPKCKIQTLKEDYSKMIQDGEDFDGDGLYCPSCGFKESRAVLVKACSHNWEPVYKGDYQTGRRCSKCRTQEWN